MAKGREDEVSGSTTTAEWYERSYVAQGLGAQRRYPNEELIRFLARNFFHLPRQERARISILDAGCGSCSNLWAIAHEGFDAHGMDISPESLRLGRQVLAGWQTAAHLSVGNFLAMPYKAESFNAVVDVFSSNVLNAEEFEGYLAELRRVLKPGGRFFLFTPSVESDAFKNHLPAKKLDEFTLNGIYREDSPYHGNFYPFRFSEPALLQQMLLRNELQPENVELVTRTYNQRAESFQFIALDAQRRR